MLFTSLEYHLVVNYPLLALSFYFPLLLPLAIVSVGLSLGVCALAAAQAELPRDRARFWSRPLIACLFFLQPLVRGWARYRTRLHLRSTSSPNLEPTLFARQGETPEQLCFWSRNGVDRFTFLKTVLRNFGRQNVPTLLDSGWDRHDVQIIRSPWTHCNLLTASEYLEEGKIFLRCRLRATWSGLAIIVFVLLVGIELAVINHFARADPWIWMTLPSLPFLVWFFEAECRQQSAQVAELVREAGSELKLEALEKLS